MSLTVLTRPACRNCHYSLLQSFAAIAGVSLSPLLLRPASQIRAPSFAPQRWYTHSHTSQSWEPLPNTHAAPVPAAKDEHPQDPPSDSPGPVTPSTPIPWYLQVDTPNPPAPTHPLAARQSIPELPPDPPAILSPILHYLSTDAGLDNLSLIDLRHLDPPPALGANLLMLIGTARSVKHLNVSADRFCRWLRSSYKMRPYADGLLGRNELKLKLRRKARRLKLAQSVGNTLEAGRDDGITTGWICVNLGSVEGVGGEGEGLLEQGPVQGVGEVLEDAESGDDDYSGFGSRSTAPRIVVQMFTEEKRAEMDLEGLWDVRTARRAARHQREADASVEDTMADDSTEEPLETQRPWAGLEGGSMASRGGYDPPRPAYGTAAT